VTGIGRDVSAVLAVLVAVLLFGLMIASTPRNRHAITTVQGGTDTPAPQATPHYEAFPIFTAQEAISTALALYPTHRSYYSETATLTTYEYVDAWRMTSSPGTQPHAPVWLVAIRSDGLHKYDVLLLDVLGYMGRDDPDLPQDLWNDTADDRPVEGAFYVLDANSGDVVGYGVLEAGTALEYQSAAAIPSVANPIASATPFPLEPTPDPTAGVQ